MACFFSFQNWTASDKRNGDNMNIQTMAYDLELTMLQLEAGEIVEATLKLQSIIDNIKQSVGSEAFELMIQYRA